MRRMLLDTASLTYRAHHALPASITDPDGQPVGGVRGVLDMHARLLTDHAPDEVVHVFDADWRPAGRVAAWPGYKAQRPAEPPEITAQFALLARVLDALGLPRAQAPGWEADDAIGALVASAAREDHVQIVTGDRDLLQLVSDEAPRVEVCYTRRGVSDLQVFDAAEVRRVHGVEPEQYVDYATLRGDASDGLPGVAGVGEKTARALIAEHGSLAAVRAATSALRPALARAITQAEDYLDAMAAVVPVRRDVAVDLVRAEPDPDRAAELAERGLGGALERLRAAHDPDSADVDRTASDGSTGR